MAGNTLGTSFAVTTFGESHGPAIGCVIDGCPPNMPLNVADIQVDLDRRRPGTSRHVTQRQEADQVEILSGVFDGKTTGTPIGLLIRNTDQRSSDYAQIASSFRPGHADYTYFQKYGIRDPRGGGRSSARLTAPMVAAGAVARKWLSLNGVGVRGYLSSLGEVDLIFKGWENVGCNPFFSPDPDSIPILEAYMDRLRRDGDSIGAELKVVASGVPVGWGSPVFDRLDADLAKALMSINAVKAVEIGDGKECVRQRGSEHGDEMSPAGFMSNHAGGILGGISTGQDIIASVAIKPTSSIRQERRSIDSDGAAQLISTIGRHDPCVGIRATPIIEAMVALVLIDHALLHRGQCADVVYPLNPIPPFC